LKPSPQDPPQRKSAEAEGVHLEVPLEVDKAEAGQPQRPLPVRTHKPYPVDEEARAVQLQPQVDVEAERQPRRL
jgi:hypothetical protein